MFGKYRISSTPTTPATPTPNGTPSSSNYFLSPLYNTTLKPTPSTKRKRTDLEMNKENILSTPEPPDKKPYSRRRSPEKKLEVIFHALSTVNWTMSDFLHYTFRTKEEDGSKNPLHRSTFKICAIFSSGNWKIHSYNVLGLLVSKLGQAYL